MFITFSCVEMLKRDALCIGKFILDGKKGKRERERERVACIGSIRGIFWSIFNFNK